MGTRADYYVGRGEKAKWLGCTAWDGNPGGITSTKAGKELLKATDAKTFRAALKRLFRKRDDFSVQADGWPWPWEDSCTTDYAYAYVRGKVWISNYGSQWFDLATHNKYLRAHKGWEKKCEEDPDYEGAEPDMDNYLTGPKARFPNMKDIQKVTLGERSGVIIASTT